MEMTILHSKTSRPAQQGTRLPIATLRRLRRLTATAALAVTLSGVGAVSLWTVPAHARPAPSSFAELAAEVSPAVVNVQTTYERQLVRDEGQQFGQRQGPKAAPPMPFPPNSPFGDFFRRFLDQPPDQYPSPHGPGPQGPGQQARGLGSGFLIDPEGHIVTNHHVIDGASGITVTLSDGRSFDAELIGSDPRTDLALLKAKSEEPLPHVSWGDSDKIRVGDWVMAVGNPFGLGGTVTAGIVSARGRDLNDQSLVDFLQLDAPINRGNSGGPSFDLEGEVIGINTAIYSPNGGSVGIGFAIPSQTARLVIEDLMDDGKVMRSWIGVRIQPLTEDIAEGFGLEDTAGALIATVDADGPAAEAGLRAGDVVLEWNGKAVSELRDLPKLVAATPVKQEVNVTVWRKGKEETLSVKTGLMNTASAEVTPASEDSLLQPGGALTLPNIGLVLDNLNDLHKERFGIEDQDGGVVVLEVMPGSPAAEAGFRTGDVIKSVSLEEIEDTETFAGKISSLRDDGETVAPALVARAGSQTFLPLTLGDA